MSTSYPTITRLFKAAAKGIDALEAADAPVSDAELYAWAKETGLKWCDGVKVRGWCVVTDHYSADEDDDLFWCNLSDALSDELYAVATRPAPKLNNPTLSVEILRARAYNR